MSYTHTVVVSCFDNQPGYNLYCEPEGAVQEVRPGDVLTIRFETTSVPTLELSRVEDGIVLGRYNDGKVTIEDKAGRPLTW